MKNAKGTKRKSTEGYKKDMFFNHVIILQLLLSQHYQHFAFSNKNRDF